MEKSPVRTTSSRSTCDLMVFTILAAGLRILKNNNWWNNYHSQTKYALNLYLDCMLDLVHFFLTDNVTLVEKDDIGEFNLVEQKGWNVSVIFIIHSTLPWKLIIMIHSTFTNKTNTLGMKVNKRKNTDQLWPLEAKTEAWFLLFYLISVSFQQRVTCWHISRECLAVNQCDTGVELCNFI